jgi:hypothetical protein
MPLVRKILSIALFAQVLFFIFAQAAPGAPSAPLHQGLEWGMSAAGCESRLLAAGYERRSGVPSDRAIYRRNALHGIREVPYGRSGKDSDETCTVILLEDALFRVSVTYERFKSGFADKVISGLTDDLSAPPRHLRGPNSKTGVYLWESGVTGVQFRYQELPALNFFMASLEYMHMPTVNGLRKLGLQ